MSRHYTTQADSRRNWMQRMSTPAPRRVHLEPQYTLREFATLVGADVNKLRTEFQLRTPAAAAPHGEQYKTRVTYPLSDLRRWWASHA